MAKNKLVESTDHEADLSGATSTEVSSQNTDEGLASKVENGKFQDVWKSWVFMTSRFSHFRGHVGP